MSGGAVLPSKGELCLDVFTFAQDAGIKLHPAQARILATYYLAKITRDGLRYDADDFRQRVLTYLDPTGESAVSRLNT